MAEEPVAPLYTALPYISVSFPSCAEVDVFSMKPANVPFFAAVVAGPESIAVPPVFDVPKCTLYVQVPVLAVPVQAAAGSPGVVVQESISTLISR